MIRICECHSGLIWRLVRRFLGQGYMVVAKRFEKRPKTLQNRFSPVPTPSDQQSLAKNNDIPLKVTVKKGSATQPNLPSRATSGSSATDPNRAIHQKLARTSLFSGYFPAFFPGWPNFPEFFRFQTGCRISCFFKHRPELIWGKDRKPYTVVPE